MINNIRVFLCIIFALFTWIKNQITKKHCTNKNILILFQQIFGDAVMISDSLKYYSRVFPSENGYSITFVSKPNVNKFMHDLLPLPKEIKFEELDFKRIQTDVLYFYLMVRKYGDNFGVIVTPGTSFSPELFSLTSTASRKEGLLPSIPRTKPFPLVWLQKHAYTSTIRPNKEMNMIQRHRMFLNHLGLSNVEGRIPELLHQNRIIKGKYCVVCPGSSMPFKIWPKERFLKVIDYVVKSYNLDVYLTGGNEEKKYSDWLVSNTKYPNRVFSKIGQTSFKEWAAIIQYSIFVLGNDSATIHLAVASRIPSICIAGVYEKLQFFPYTVDVLDKGDMLPITLYEDMYCEYCRTKSYFAGWGNLECKKRIRKGLCATCINSISVNKVVSNIDALMFSMNYNLG